MARLHYRSTVGMNPEPFIKHFKEQAEGRGQKVHLISSSNGFRGNQKQQGLILVHQGSGLGQDHKRDNVTRIETIDPVKSATNQAASMLDNSIKESRITNPPQSYKHPRKRQKVKSSSATVKKVKSKKPRTGKDSVAATARKRTQRVKDVFSEDKFKTDTLVS